MTTRKGTVPPATNNGEVWNTPYTIDGSSSSRDLYPLVYPPISLSSPLKAIRLSRTYLTPIPTFLEYSKEFKIVLYNGDHSDKIVWNYSSNADWLTFDSDHLLKGRPMSQDVGSWWINISVTDGILTDFINFTIVVFYANFNPIITTLDVTSMDQWDEYYVDYNATDFESDLKWRLLTNATFLSLDNVTGELTGSPGSSDAGVFFINISVTDGELWDNHNFHLNVTDINDPPMQNPSKISLLLLEDTPISYSIYDLFFDNDNDPLTVRVSGTSKINTFIDDDNKLHIEPDENWFGEGLINFSVSDGYYNRTFSIEVIVQEMNDVPSELNITFSNNKFIENGDQTVTANYFDPDIGDDSNITWFIDGIVVSHNISHNLSLNKGAYNLTLRVSDSSGNFSEITVLITVEGEAKRNTPQSDPNCTLFIILVVVLLSLVLVGSLIVILRKRSSLEEEEELPTFSNHISNRSPGESGLDLVPSFDISSSGVNGGQLDQGPSVDKTDIPWFENSNLDLDGLMEQVLNEDHVDPHDTSSMIKRLKRKRLNEELTKEEFEELRSNFLEIYEE